MWKFFELHHDFTVATRQAFTCAQIERHTSPSPVADMRFDSHKGFGIRFTVCAFLFQIAGYLGPVYSASMILTAYCAALHFIGPNRLQAAQNFQFLVVYGASLERR